MAVWHLFLDPGRLYLASGAFASRRLWLGEVCDGARAEHAAHKQCHELLRAQALKPSPLAFASLFQSSAAAAADAAAREAAVPPPPTLLAGAVPTGVSARLRREMVLEEAEDIHAQLSKSLRANKLGSSAAQLLLSQMRRDSQAEAPTGRRVWPREVLRGSGAAEHASALGERGVHTAANMPDARAEGAVSAPAASSLACEVGRSGARHWTSGNNRSRLSSARARLSQHTEGTSEEAVRYAHAARLPTALPRSAVGRPAEPCLAASSARRRALNERSILGRTGLRLDIRDGYDSFCPASPGCSNTVERLTAAKLSRSPRTFEAASMQLQQALGSDSELRAQLARLVKAKQAKREGTAPSVVPVGS